MHVETWKLYYKFFQGKSHAWFILYPFSIASSDLNLSTLDLLKILELKINAMSRHCVNLLGKIFLHVFFIGNSQVTRSKSQKSLKIFT